MPPPTARTASRWMRQFSPTERSIEMWPVAPLGALRAASLLRPGKTLSAWKIPAAIVVACICAFAVSSVGKTESGPSSALHRTALGIMQLQSRYNSDTGLYNKTGWWNSANALTVLIDYARLSGSHQFDPVIANTYSTAQKQHPGFLNKFYDDEGWWALAWVDAYDLTGNRQYLSGAEAIFGDMTTGWDETCGGGIWWNKDRHYKNAITNELFFSVAAHLANRDSSRASEYLNWANKEWQWFAHSGIINAQSLINDGLKLGTGQGTDTSCQNNGGKVWSYNQGVVLGGLTELARANPDPTLRDTADRVAEAAMHSLSDANGVLHDPCEPYCGGDGVQFKGIFIRNVIALDRVNPRAEFRSFVNANANSIWLHAQGSRHQFGQVWSGPFNGSNAGIQSSALDALIGAAELERRIDK